MSYSKKQKTYPVSAVDEKLNRLHDYQIDDTPDESEKEIFLKAFCEKKPEKNNK